MNHLVVCINIKLDGSKSSFGCWLTDCSPCGCSLLLAAFGVMNLSVCEVEAESLLANFIFNRCILLRHDSNLNTVDFRLSYFHCKRALSCGWKHLVHFQNVP